MVGLLANARALPAAPGPAAAVTFNEHVAPIVFTQCATCHRPGEAAPFSLLTYEDVRRRARQIAVVTKNRYMPPWKPDAGYGFAGERRLTDEEIRLIQEWVEGGALEGDPKALQQAPATPIGWQLGQPDLVVALQQPYRLPPDGPDAFRTFVIAIPIETTRYVRALEFRPDDKRVIHHANLKIDRTGFSRRRDAEDAGVGFEGGAARGAEFPDGHFLGWTPGQRPYMLPADMAWRLERGSDLVIELHLRPNGKPENVQFSVGLFFTDTPPSRVPYMLRLGRQDIDIPAGDSRHLITDAYVLPVDVDLLSIQPHAHYLAKEVVARAELPDGTIRPLLRIADWDFNWQDVYRYAEPVSLPRGTRIVMQYRYDNSAANDRNPHRPPVRVTFGQTSSSEMGDVWLQVMTHRQEDRAVLDADFAPKMLREDIAGDEKIVEMNPRDGWTRIDLGLLYLAAGRTDDALAQFGESAAINPDSWVSHYELGRALLGRRRLDEAAVHFSKSLILRGDISETHNNLGAVRFLQGRSDEALREFREALRIAPDNTEARFNTARALAARGQLDEALREYRAVLQVRPDDAASHAAFASAAAMKGELVEAVAHYRRALQLEPNLPAALVDLAWILATTDRVDIRSPREAVDLAERVARLTDYRDPTVLETLALAYAAAGDLNQAINTAEAGIPLARTAGLEELARTLEARVASYRRQPPR